MVIDFALEEWESLNSVQRGTDMITLMGESKELWMVMREEIRSRYTVAPWNFASC